MRIRGKNPKARCIYFFGITASRDLCRVSAFCGVERALQLCCQSWNKCSKLKTTTVWKSQTSRSHRTSQGIFFIGEFQNYIISEFNHKSAVWQFNKQFNSSQFLHTENHQNCWQVETSAESQELHKRAFTSNKRHRGSSHSGSCTGWDGMGWPSTGRLCGRSVISLNCMPCTGVTLLP